MKVKHNAEVLVGNYQFADRVKEQVLSSLKTCNPIPVSYTHLRAHET